MKDLLKSLIQADTTCVNGEADAAEILRTYLTDRGIGSRVNCWDKTRANIVTHIKSSGARNGRAYFFGCDNGGINKILVYMSNSDTQLDVKVGNRSNNNIITLSTETWYHVALTWNAGIYAIYVDGSPLDTGTYGGLSSLPSTADIGNNGNSSTQSLHGLINEVMIFHKSLSAEEIQQLYQDGPN